MITMKADEAVFVNDTKSIFVDAKRLVAIAQERHADVPALFSV